MIKYYIPLLGLYFAFKGDKVFMAYVVLINIAYIILGGFLFWFLNLPAFNV